MPQRAVSSERVFQPSLPLAQATPAGGFRFVRSRGPDLQGRAAPGEVRAPTPQRSENIRTLIEEAGGALSDVVACTVRVTGRAHRAPMNEVHFASFAVDPPHRLSCIVRGLGSPDGLAEIDATAHLGRG